MGRDAAERAVGVAGRVALPGAARPDAPTCACCWRPIGAIPGSSGHPLEVGHAFLQERLPALVERINRGREPAARMPRLAALVCASAFDLALHDAFGVLHGVPAYATYNRRYLNHDLSRYLTPAAGSGVSFAGTYPEDFLRAPPRRAAGVALGGRTGSGRAGRAGRERAGRWVPGAAARLGAARRAHLPEGQAARHGRGVGLRPAPAGGFAGHRGGGGVAVGRLQLHGHRPRLRDRHPRPAAARAAADLRHAPVRGAALSRTTWNATGWTCAAWRRASRCSWTRAPTTGRWCGWAGSSAGPGWR